jgi:plastocyanin
LKRANTLRLTVAVAALGVLGVVAGGSAATASPDEKAADVAVITAEKEGKKLFFDGPETVEQGQVLKFKSKTDLRKVGPHTLSLVTRQSLPGSRTEIKECGKELAAICGAIVKWHEIDLETFEVPVKTVEAGKPGWDTQGTEKRKGDSSYLEREGSSFKQKVTAKEGTTLNYICVVHPNMQGKIKVEG